MEHSTAVYNYITLLPNNYIFGICFINYIQFIIRDMLLQINFRFWIILRNNKLHSSIQITLKFTFFFHFNLSVVLILTNTAKKLLHEKIKSIFLLNKYILYSLH